ncbi:MAG: NAD(P)/FAD-dependent oxidoreductase [Candidatus Omnitrophota bacterium]
MEKTDITIIGAGVVGLSIAACLAKKGKEVVVLEKHPAFGQETSSRNSEIIHAGLYYKKDSLRTRLCVEGKKKLYEFCSKHGIGHRKLGKIIVATDNKQVRELEALFSRGRNNGVDDLKMLTQNQVIKLEPNVKAVSAIHSPSTGIIDTHNFMKSLEYQAKSNNAVFAYGCEVVGIEKAQGGYCIDTREGSAEGLRFFSRILINSAGLNSGRIAMMAGLDINKEGYNIYYNKAEYFRVNSKKANLTNMLIYPTPGSASLGIHTVNDLQGQLRLGPSSFYTKEINYDVDPLHKLEFYQACKRFLPFLESDDLSPDIAGIRPKLQAPGEGEKDFVIVDETKKGFPGLINLIGIESPGLTASLAIADYVAAFIN